MKLNLIATKFPDMTTLDVTIGLLKQSCKELNCDFNIIFSDEFDFSNYEPLTSEDLVYCLTEDHKARLIENLITNDQVKHLYKDIKYCYAKNEDGDDITSMIVHKDHGLPTIPTIPAITSDKPLMEKYVNSLGGLPIVIKAIGNTSHGLGTMRLDSWPSLFSVTDYLASQGDEYILKSYIDVAKHLRVIVLGDKVIDSIEYITPDNDFRSNIGASPTVKPAAPEDNIKNIAVAAVNSLGYLFGGVDILVDKDGNPFIAEVNFPCYFGRAQQTTGTPIASLLVEFLIRR